MKKIIAMLAIFVLAGTVLSGCSLSAKGVRLANKKEIIAYVQNAVGNAEFIKAVKGENRIDYYFKEPVTGIEFIASTYASSQGLDGATFYYTERKRNDFYEKYADAIMDEIEPELNKIPIKYNSNVVIKRDVSYANGGECLISVSFLHYEENFTEDDIVKIAGEVADVLEGKEPLGKYGFLRLVKGNYDLLGMYDLTDRVFIPKEDDYDENMNEYFERMIHMHGYAGENKPKKHSVFLRKEEMRVGDIPGIENVEILQNVMYDDIPNITMDTTVTLYYYEFDGKEYFVADHIHIDSDYDRGKLYIGAAK